MKHLKTQINIAASAQEVWEVLMDFSSYPEWNPFLIEVKGEARVGNHLSNTIQSNEKKTMKFTPEVLVVKPNQEFRWKGKLFVKGLFDGEHYFKLHSNADGSTDLEHGEIFTGLMAGALFKMIEADTIKGFQAMNDALKQRVEAKGEEVRHAS